MAVYLLVDFDSLGRLNDIKIYTVPIVKNDQFQSSKRALPLMAIVVGRVGVNTGLAIHSLRIQFKMDGAMSK